MARPGSRVRPLEASGNRRPREMIVAPLTRGTEPGLQAFSGARYSITSPAAARCAGGTCARDPAVSCLDMRSSPPPLAPTPMCVPSLRVLLVNTN